MRDMMGSVSQQPTNQSPHIPPTHLSPPLAIPFLLTCRPRVPLTSLFLVPFPFPIPSSPIFVVPRPVSRSSSITPIVVISTSRTVFTRAFSISISIAVAVAVSSVRASIVFRPFLFRLFLFGVGISSTFQYPLL